MTTVAGDTAFCRECGTTLSRDAVVAYRDLYGATVWRPGWLAERLEQYLEQRPDAADEHVLAVVLPEWLGYELQALVVAARHRLAEDEN